MNADEECNILKAVVFESDNYISEIEQKVERMEDEFDAIKKAMAGFIATSDLKTLEAETVKRASAAVLDGLTLSMGGLFWPPFSDNVMH